MQDDILCRPLRLGGLLIPSRLFLAPMAGITDDVMRMLCHRFGAALTYTEMVSAKGLLMSEKSRELLLSRPDGGPVAAQLFGHEADVMSQAAMYIQRHCTHISMIDINMGCPAHKIVRSGEGSALLTDLKQAANIMERVVRSVSLPVSVKIRLGFSKGADVSTEFARIAMDCGVCAVTVHGRTKDQGYAGVADWDAVKRFKQSVGDRLVVIGNGDVKNTVQARSRMEQSGCDAVMIGRAAIGNPWVFSGKTPDASERLNVIFEHLALESEKYGEAYAITSLRKILAAYIHGIPGAAKARAAIFKATDMTTVKKELEELFMA